MRIQCAYRGRLARRKKAALAEAKQNKVPDLTLDSGEQDGGKAEDGTPAAEEKRRVEDQRELEPSGRETGLGGHLQVEEGCDGLSPRTANAWPPLGSTVLV
eukprot:Sspe_Gene.95151::Locus_67465_Transcript_1_1_Confidence_1.000_Length_301::g.95151::m.95151